MRIFVLALLIGLVGFVGGAAAQALPAATPEGILIDRVLNMSHLEDLDGSPAASASDVKRLRQAAFELTRAAEQAPAWKTSSLRHTGGHTPEIPLAVLWAGYDRLDTRGEPRAHQVFAFAPLQEDVYHGSQLTLTLSPELVMTHRKLDPVRWHLDAGDGLGWRELSPGKGLDVRYDTTGPRTLLLKAELADGQTVQGRSVLQIQRLDTPDPTATWPITATQSFGGAFGAGLAHLYLAPEHTQLTDPVIVVEGFDLDNSMDWPVLYDLLNQENLIEDLRTQGRDAVVLDFSEATAPIQQNAFVLTRLLQLGRQEIGPEVPVQVVGASMGGLVTRFALTYLENQGVPHGVDTFISFDSPQTGANIPLGLQHWLDFFKDEAAEADYLLSRLNTPAARQMLLYHYQNGGVAADPLFDDLRSNLLALGNWPSQPRLVAVANGSGLNQDQGFNAGAQLVRYEYRSFLADIDGNVWAVPDGGPQVIFDGMINLVWPLPDTDETITVSGTLPWDSAPGGFRPSLAQMDTTPVPYGDIEALHPAHCFIPTISALALDTDDPLFEISGAADLLAMTPFDAVYYPAVNQEHIAITPESKAWFMAELQAGVTAVPGAELLPMARPQLDLPVPNPFNPRVTLAFSLDRGAAVDFRVFDLKGRLVRTLVSGQYREAGRHEETWSGRDDAGRTLAAGVYWARLKVGETQLQQRLTLVK
jgi:hypothetical protein|nr:FlgD immunoglobulin-like domain containing protein [Candidatus Krumholzibacteria bacterium]